MHLLRTLAILSLLLAPATALAAKAAPSASAPASADWTRTVTVTPKGSFILGNPNAKTKLVEYMSYSCPHCAAFAKEANPELKAGWIRRGALSIEYRNFIRDSFDLSAALLARCGGQGRFLANHELIFSSYDDWIKQADSYAQAHSGADNRDRAAVLTDIADKVGLTALVAKNGVTSDAAHKCVADPNALATVLALTAGAWDADPNFEGTPTFVLDGKVLSGVHDWKRLKPLLPPLPAPGK